MSLSHSNPKKYCDVDQTRFASRCVPLVSSRLSFGPGKFPTEFLVAVLLSINVATGQISTGNSATFSIKGQPYQRAEECLPCHQRQFDELRTAVKSGYRNVSPLFNSLELAGNFLSGGRLRPVYGDSTKVSADGTPLRSNLVSTKKFTHINQMQAGFCIGCHTPHAILMGEDPDKREIPELSGVGVGARHRCEE